MAIKEQRMMIKDHHLSVLQIFNLLIFGREYFRRNVGYNRTARNGSDQPPCATWRQLRRWICGTGRLPG